MSKKKQQTNPFTGLLVNQIGPLMVAAVTARKIQEDWPQIWYKKGYRDAKAGKPEMDFSKLKKKKEATQNE